MSASSKVKAEAGPAEAAAEVAAELPLLELGAPMPDVKTWSSLAEIVETVEGLLLLDAAQPSLVS